MTTINDYIEYVDNITLTDIQRAHYEMSLSWKINSGLLLNADDEKDFKSAVRWCGAYGNVSRTVSVDNVDDLYA